MGSRSAVSSGKPAGPVPLAVPRRPGRSRQVRYPPGGAVPPDGWPPGAGGLVRRPGLRVRRPVSGTAVGQGVAVRVGDGHAPRRGRVAGGLGGQGAGEGGVDGPEPGRFAGVLGQAEQGGQRDGQVDLRGGADRRGRRAARPGPAGLSRRRTAAGGTVPRRCTRFTVRPAAAPTGTAAAAPTGTTAAGSTGITAAGTAAAGVVTRGIVAAAGSPRGCAAGVVTAGASGLHSRGCCCRRQGRCGWSCRARRGRLSLRAWSLPGLLLGQLLLEPSLGLLLGWLGVVW